MGRPRGIAGLRTVVIASRFTEAEAAWIDRRRKSLSRAEYLRMLVLKDRRESHGT